MAHQTSQPRVLRGDEAQLFRDYELPLRAAVRHHAHVGDDIVDDACAFAWLQLCRTQPDRTTVFAWLRTVAIREAWRLCERDSRERPIEHLPTACEPRRGDLSREIDARDALRALADLPPKQRDTLGLLVFGLSYAEIATQRRVTKTNVNRHLVRARRHLRLVRDDS